MNTNLPSYSDLITCTFVVVLWELALLGAQLDLYHILHVISWFNTKWQHMV
jgi:hypothetical protein